MYKTVDDIKNAAKQNGIELQKKVAPEVRAHAQAVRKDLKELEIYVRKLNGLSFQELVEEYNSSSDALLVNDAERKRLDDERREFEAKYDANMQENANKREIELLRIAAVGEALRVVDFKPIVAAPVVASPAKKQKTLNQKYVEAMMLMHDGKKATVKKILLDEGYDPESVNEALKKCM